MDSPKLLCAIFDHYWWGFGHARCLRCSREARHIHVPLTIKFNVTPLIVREDKETLEDLPDEEADEPTRL